MGLFSTFSKKPSLSGTTGKPVSSFGNIRGKISRLEIKNVHRDLVSRFGRTKGERIYSVLQPNMDREHGFGSSGITTREMSDAIENMEKNPYDGIDKGDTKKLRDVLEKRL